MPDGTFHLAFLLPTLGGGGAERTIIKLAGGLLSRGHTVDLVLVHKNGPLIKEIPEQANVIDLHAPRRFSSRALTSLPSLVKYIKNTRPDILYTGLMTNYIALWAGKIANTSTKVIISERNTLSVEVNQYPFDIRFRLLPFFTRIFYPWSDGIVAVSHAVADDLCKLTNIDPKKITVIYNPVLTPSLLEKSRMTVNHPWFVTGQPPVILSVGRLTAQKDYPTLIHAFARVRQSLPVRLIILGEGEQRAYLEQLIKKLGIEQDVELPGFVDNPYPYLKNASVFVLSSKYEGLPGVLIEALFCGARVIATDCPGGSGEILGNGKYGTLVPVGNPEVLAIEIMKQLGRTICIPEESWKPFELGYVLDQYEDLFYRVGREIN